MSRTSSIEEPETWWMSYLKGIQRRKGWSIARIVRESGGQLTRTTLFRMVSGRKRQIDVATIRLIAAIVGDDPDVIVRHAGGSVLVDAVPEELQGLRAKGLDPADPVVLHHIMTLAAALAGVLIDAGWQPPKQTRGDRCTPLPSTARAERH